MRLRRRFLTSVIRCSLMLSAAMSLSEAARASTALTPDSNWAVSKIAASKTVGGGAYCALARRYSNGSVLTLARNSRDESSMAIDFQKNSALDKDTNYTVVLKPGSAQERSFNVHPVSGRALVVRLGKDYAFYDALNRAGSLNVQIGEDSYAFSMADFDTGEQQINGCLASLSEPAAGGDVAAVPEKKAVKVADAGTSATDAPEAGSEAMAQSAASADALAFKASQGEVPSDVHALREENAKLKTSLAKARRSDDSGSEQDKNSGLAAELNDKIETLQRENTTLRHQVASAKPMSDVAANAAEAKALKSENARLQEQIAMLQAKASEAAAAGTTTADADQKLAEANAKAEEADRKLALADKELAAANQKTAENSGGTTAQADADKKLAEANAKLDLANKKVVDADQKLSQADQKLMDASQKAAQVNTSLTSSNDQQAAAQAKLAEATQKLNDANAKLAEADKRLADATQKSQAADQRLAANSAEDTDASQKLALADQKLNDATAKLMEANQKLANAQASATGTAAGAQMMAEARQKLQQADIRMAEADKKLSDAAQRVAQSGSQTTQDSQQLAALQAKLDQANMKLADANKVMTGGVDKNATADQKLALASQKLLEANQKLEAAQKLASQNSALPVAAASPTADQKMALAAQKLAEADQRMRDADAKAATADQKLAEAQKLATEKVAAGKPDKQTQEIIASLQTQVQSLEQENAGLKDSLKVAQAQEAKAGALQVASSGITPQQLHAVEDQLNTVTEERNHLKQQIEADQQSGEDHLMKISSSNWNLEEATRRYNEAERQIRSLGQQVEEAQVQYQADKKKLENQLFDPAIATQQQIAQLNALQATVDQEHAELDAANKHISDLESRKPAPTVAMAAPVVSSVVPAAKLASTAPAAKPSAPVDFSTLKPAGTLSVSDKAAAAPAPVAKNDHYIQPPQQVADSAMAGQSKALADIPPSAGAKAGSADAANDSTGFSSKPETIQVASLDVSAKVPATSAPVSLAVAPVTGPRFMSSGDLQSFLGSSVPLKNGIETGAAPANAIAYKWQSGALFGSAEQTPVGTGSSAFDDKVAAYLAKAKKHCDGTFAAEPGMSQDDSGTRAKSYEIACVGDSANASASVLFYSQNGLFTTIAHEGSIDDMDTAMDIRDKLMSKLMQTKVALN